LDDLVADLTSRTSKTINLLVEIKVWLKLSLPTLHEGDFMSSLVDTIFSQVDGAERVGRLLLSSVNANFGMRRAEMQRLYKKNKMGTEESYQVFLLLSFIFQVNFVLFI